jgi:hypothetical protein
MSLPAHAEKSLPQADVSLTLFGFETSEIRVSVIARNTKPPIHARIRQPKDNNNIDLALAPGGACLYLKS